MAKRRVETTKPAAAPTFETDMAVQCRITGLRSESTISASCVGKLDTGFGSVKNRMSQVKGHTVSCKECYVLTLPLLFLIPCCLFTLLPIRLLIPGTALP